MPTMTTLSNCKIAVFANDHNPPHFHILASDGSKALVEIGTLKVIRGAVKAATLKEAQAWAASNTALLAAKWKELNP